ncbi:hypothetical protein BURK2_02151 [Burkholderiales bacterium]|nr:MAG: hypothetical protein F9K47_16075 [Burkholderiales bacterium]CAG0986715.1 hypothetical protein BURK2_02151 [Burkholderiales bacterium]
MTKPAPQAAVAFLSRNAHLWLAAHRTRHGTPAEYAPDKALDSEIIIEAGERWGLSPEVAKAALKILAVTALRAVWAKM